MKWLVPFAAVALYGQPPKPTPAPPDFYDPPPTYIVSGVTDYTNRGGHGADTVLRSAEALAKAAVAMGASTSSRAAAEEAAGRPVEALRLFQQAAEQDPNEANLFDLGSELLKHHAPEQAAEVFGKGARLFPRSLRLLLAGAAASYSAGAYDQARERFFAAVDLEPSDADPYLFLGKAGAPEITGSEGYAARMKRFAQMHPGNAWANYYFALTLKDPSEERRLLNKAVRLDPNLAVAWFQLGVLKDGGADSIAAWNRAVAADPKLQEAHYRLANAYRRVGDSAHARTELEIYERLSKESAEQLEKERKEVKKFTFQQP